MTGQQLLGALENGVSHYPQLEGRFPQVGHRAATKPLKVGSVCVGAVSLSPCAFCHPQIRNTALCRLPIGICVTALPLMHLPSSSLQAPIWTAPTDTSVPNPDHLVSGVGRAFQL